ncbi:PREDICTED: PC-esterase domain-containing protein 1A isoform X2 [Elephantulus edwardii]|uniref:PC-esterase domain-containing protein 1A isoform X2 n=1 Tax=Elephantulus edwardii TaxID=28737 RepID=UPI0003F0E103|nr:PREDICTED: PC-esterase domain-containing protein 1A isoform X2 [Elephantulus edwardii]
MVFCLENEKPRSPPPSAMAHFQASEVQQLLHNKFVVILGDSIQRSVYKDLVLLLQRDSLLTAAQLKTKYLEDILEELTYGPTPDLVIINSCLWDLSRYGRYSMESYRENLERVFVRMDQVLPDSCLLVWNMAMPLGERVTGGFLLPELQPLAASLRRDVVEGNFYSATLAGGYCFDVLDLHFHFRHAVRHRHRDGVHWDQIAHRHLSHLLLTHVADAWGVELPKRNYLPDPWMEDWLQMDRPFREICRQPLNLGNQMALCPPLPSPMAFPCRFPQPLSPPMFPPLPQDAPFYPHQPFPPRDCFDYDPVKDFSRLPNSGRDCGVNFGPLPPPIPGPVSHGQHRSLVIHQRIPRYIPYSPYPVSRMGVPCRKRPRHLTRLVRTYKQEGQPPAHLGTWPG